MHQPKPPSPPCRPGATQSALPLEPQPEQVREEAEALMCRWYWRRRYRSLEQLEQADPEAARRLFLCAKGAVRARLRAPAKKR